MMEAAVALRIVVSMVAVALVSTGFAGQTPAPSPLPARARTLRGVAPSLRGQVHTPDAKPVAGAVVRVEAQLGPGVGVAAVTDAAGGFETAGLAPGVYRLIVAHKDWAVTIWSGVRLESPGHVDVDVILRAPVRVSGRLVDAQRRPRTGTVSLQEIEGQGSPHSLGALVRAEPGADGRFTLERLPAGSLAFVAGGNGVPSRLVPVQVGPRQRVADVGDLVLEPGAHIRGRVRDKMRAPIAGAVVRGFADWPVEPGVPAIEGRTEPDGTFVLGATSAPRYRLSVRVPGVAPLTRDVYAPSDGVELVLDTEGGIAGLVVDDGDRPVESFWVTATSHGARMGRLFTGESGRFALDGVPAGTYTVEVTTGELGRQTASNVKVEKAAVTDLGRIRLAPGGSVHGTVIDAASAPVAGAAVEVRGSESESFPSPFNQGTTTDSAGSFQLRGLRTETVVIVARHPDFVEGRSAPVDIAPDRTAEASVVLARGGRIEGGIRRRGAGPLPEASISVQPLAGQPNFMAPGMILARPDGSFVIEHVPPGRVGVVLMTSSGPREMPTGQLFQEVEVREGETARVEFVWRQILVSGKVTRGDRPLAKIRLIARGTVRNSFGGRDSGIPDSSPGPQHMTALTREDGSYEMIVREAGRIWIQAESAGPRMAFPMRIVEVADVESQTVNLVYPAGGISGVVVGEQTGAPIARASVHAMNTDTGTGGGATTGEDGRFTIDVDPGEFHVHAVAEAHTPAGVTVTVGDSPAPDIRLRLSPGASIRGRVVDGQGLPVPHLSLSAREETQLFGASARSGPDGSFAFSSLKPGSYVLVGGSPLNGFGVLRGVTTGAADVVFRLSPGGRIRVTAREGSDTPADGVFVVVRGMNGAPVQFSGVGGRTGNDGTVEIDSPAGLIEVEAREGRSVRSRPGHRDCRAVAALEVTLAEETTPPAP